MEKFGVPCIISYCVKNQEIKNGVKNRVSCIRKKLAYLKLYSYDENGVVADIKNIIILQDGTITMENAIGKPKPEKPTKTE